MNIFPTFDLLITNKCKMDRNPMLNLDELGLHWHLFLCSLRRSLEGLSGSSVPLIRF